MSSSAFDYSLFPLPAAFSQRWHQQREEGSLPGMPGIVSAHLGTAALPGAFTLPSKSIPGPSPHPLFSSHALTTTVLPPNLLILSLLFNLNTFRVLSSESRPVPLCPLHNRRKCYRREEETACLIFGDDLEIPRKERYRGDSQDGQWGEDQREGVKAYRCEECICFWNKGPQTRRLKTTGMYCLSSGGHTCEIKVSAAPGPL